MSYESWSPADWSMALAFVGAAGFALGRAWEQEFGPGGRRKRAERETKERLERILALPDDQACVAMAKRLLEAPHDPEDPEARLRMFDQAHALAEKIGEDWRGLAREREEAQTEP